MVTRFWGVRFAVMLAVVVPALAAPAARAAGPWAGIARVGAAPGSAPISLALPLRADEAGLERLATAVSTPGSPQYGQYESIASLSRRYGASAADRARVLGYLRHAGATPVGIDATGLFAHATMPVAIAQRLFGTSLGVFHGARTGRFVAPGGRVTLPGALRGAVTGVVGLDGRPLVSGSALHAAPAAPWPARMSTSLSSPAESTDTLSGYLNRSGLAAGCRAAVAQPGFTPNQYLGAYGYTPLQTAGFSGQGERVALIEIDGFRESDLHAFSRCFGLATPSLQGFLVGLRHPLAPGGEATLDLEVLDAAAPKLEQVDVYESGPTAADVLSSLTAPLDNHGFKPDVISASLGACEPVTRQAIGNAGLRTAEGALALAAASGISVLASSGDAGSSACVSDSGRPEPALAVSYPASSPFVTGVGGTNFVLDAANQITTQTVWNDAPAVLASGGGGNSVLFRRPAYQDSFQTTGRRGVPDVSMLADVAPGYEIYCSVKGACVNKSNPRSWTQVGGTSAASPLLAGGLALVDQSLRLHGHQDVGLANPLLYQIDHSPIGPAVISDVTSNTNDLGPNIDGSPLLCCTAGPGYDLASGLGSVNLTAFALAAGSLVPSQVEVGLELPSQRRPVASRHLVAKVSCSGRCLLGAYASVAVGRSRKLVKAYSTVYLLRRAGAKSVTIAFSKQQLARLRGALASGARVSATVFGVVLDPGGNVERRTPGKRLRILR
jgi:subtilase family serine protease